MIPEEKDYSKHIAKLKDSISSLKKEFSTISKAHAKMEKKEAEEEKQAKEDNPENHKMALAHFNAQYVGAKMRGDNARAELYKKKHQEYTM